MQYTHLCDLHTKEPLSLVEEYSLILAVLQIFHHSPDFIGSLGSLAKISPASKPCHNHLHVYICKDKPTCLHSQYSLHFVNAYMYMYMKQRFLHRCNNKLGGGSKST